MKKNLLTLVVTLSIILVCLCLLPTKAHAASESDLTFELNSDGASYCVSDCSSSLYASGALTIPATHNGKPVTGIGDSAFSGCQYLTSVTIPDSVTYIGDFAFSWCTDLSYLTVPNSVTSIGNGAFRGCIYVKSINIPSGVTSIGDNAFQSCGTLRYITIPDSVTSIGDNAFYHCSNLRYITIPDSVTSIGDAAFECCKGLISATIGNSVTSIGDEAFYDCTSLTSVVLPKGMDRIYDDAFENCSKLATVYHRGTQADWDDIIVDSGNDALLNATIVHNFTGDIPKPSQVIVGSGTADKFEAEAGETVTIIAATYPNGIVFDKWVVNKGAITLADPTATTTTFVMPNEDVEIAATYRDAYHSVKVVDGTADKSEAEAGETVTIAAATATNGKVFDKWVVDKGTITLADPTATTTTFVMPKEDVKVTGTYKDVNVGGNDSNQTTTPNNQPDNSTSTPNGSTETPNNPSNNQTGTSNGSSSQTGTSNNQPDNSTNTPNDSTDTSTDQTQESTNTSTESTDVTTDTSTEQTGTPTEPTDDKKDEGGMSTVLIVVLSVVLVGGAAAATVFVLIKKGILTINVK